jgi:hypothetical protein
VVDDAVECALELGTVDPGTIALIARNLIAEQDTKVAPLDVGHLSRYDRPTGDTATYDELLDRAVAR